MGYMIGDVSKELGVSEKSILRRLKDNNFKEFIYKENETVYIKDEGIKYILDNSSNEDMFIENMIKIKEIEEVKDRQILYLNKEIEILRLEKEHLSDRIVTIEGILNKREEEIVKLKEKLKNMNSLEERYNILYSKMSKALKIKEKESKKKKASWIKF